MIFYAIKIRGLMKSCDLAGGMVWIWTLPDNRVWIYGISDIFIVVVLVVAGFGYPATSK